MDYNRNRNQGNQNSKNYTTKSYLSQIDEKDESIINSVRKERSSTTRINSSLIGRKENFPKSNTPILVRDEQTGQKQFSQNNKENEFPKLPKFTSYNTRRKDSSDDLDTTQKNSSYSNTDPFGYWELPQV